MIDCNFSFCNIINLTKQKIFKTPIQNFLPDTIKNESLSAHSIQKTIIFKNIYIATNKTYIFFIDSNGFLKRIISSVL